MRRPECAGGGLLRGAYREGEGRGAMRGEGAPRGSSQSELSSGGGRAREFRTAATHTAGRRHADDRLEVAHVAAEAVASYAPAEDAAVVVEVADATVARAAVVYVQLVTPPHQAAHAWQGRGRGLGPGQDRSQRTGCIQRRRLLLHSYA